MAATEDVPLEKEIGVVRERGASAQGERVDGEKGAGVEEEHGDTSERMDEKKHGTDETEEGVPGAEEERSVQQEQGDSGRDQAVEDVAPHREGSPGEVPPPAETPAGTTPAVEVEAQTDTKPLEHVDDGELESKRAEEESRRGASMVAASSDAGRKVGVEEDLTGEQMAGVLRRSQSPGDKLVTSAREHDAGSHASANGEHGFKYQMGPVLGDGNRSIDEPHREHREQPSLQQRFGLGTPMGGVQPNRNVPGRHDMREYAKVEGMKHSPVAHEQRLDLDTLTGGEQPNRNAFAGHGIREYAKVDGLKHSPVAQEQPSLQQRLGLDLPTSGLQVSRNVPDRHGMQGVVGGSTDGFEVHHHESREFARRQMQLFGPEISPHPFGQSPWNGQQGRHGFQQPRPFMHSQPARNEATPYSNTGISPHMQHPIQFPPPSAYNGMPSPYGTQAYAPGFMQAPPGYPYGPALPRHGYYVQEEIARKAQPRAETSVKRKAEEAALDNGDEDEDEDDYQPSEDESDDSDSDSEEDLPLMNRKRRATESSNETPSPSQEEDEEVQYIGTNPLAPSQEPPKHAPGIQIKPESDASPFSSRPLPVLQDQSIPAPTSPDEISFKLPPYNVEVVPMESSEDLPQVKVSIPGMVREVLVLTPDHAIQEIHLLKNLFIPGQQELTTPDPQPMVAVLNFHTVCTMVLEAYVAYQAGDLTCGGEDEEREDVLSADKNEIFFAVIDRWRVGLAEETLKPAYKLVRGVQEFCDIALDVIFYLDEHGFIEGERRMRKERSDKGTKKTKKEVKKAGGAKAGKKGGEAPKRGPGRPRKEESAKATTKKKNKAGVTVLTARKKVKKEPTVSVVRKGV